MSNVTDPRELYTFEVEPPRMERPILLYGLSGFVDAGRAVRRARTQMFDHLEHEVLVSFDSDPLIDYRSWRPQMKFDEDRYTDYAYPLIELHHLTDLNGQPFLLLTGREPDLQWERFVAAVEQLVETLDVGLSVELHSIPMSVPHTRPVSCTAHGNRADLVAGVRSWTQSARIPASAGALLEYRLGQAHHDTFGVAVHVPHYLAEGEYPASAASLLDVVSGSTGLALPAQSLHEMASEARQHIDEQVQQSEELAQMVTTMEEQYDSWAQADARESLTDVAGELPTAEELANQFERFLAEHDERRDGST